MGLTQNLGRLSPSIFTDSSLNVGIAAAPSGTYKFEVTGTSKFTSNVGIGSLNTSWQSTAYALQAGTTVALSAYGLSKNLYFDGTDYRALTTGYGSLIQSTSGGFSFYSTTTSVTAAAIATLTSSLLTITNTGAATLGTTASTTYGTLNVIQQSVSSPSFVRGIELVHPNGTGSTGGYMGISMTGVGQGTIQVGTDAAVGNLLLQSQGGNVGIGTSSPASLLSIQRGASGDNMEIIGSGASGYSDILFYNTNKVTRLGYIDWSDTQARWNVEANIPLILYTSGSERLRITSGGDFYVNSGAATFYGAYGSAVTYISGGSTQITCVVSSGGVKLTSGATSWVSNSDERLKTDLLPISDGLNKVLTLRALTGRLKTDEEGFSRSFLIAQDVQKVLPEAIYEDTDEDKTLGIRYTEVIPLLVAAIQEQQATITSLQDRLTKGGL